MNFKVGDKVIYINEIYKDEVGSVTKIEFSGIGYRFFIVKFNNDLIGEIPINPKNIRKLTKLEQALK